MLHANIQSLPISEAFDAHWVASHIGAPVLMFLFMSTRPHSIPAVFHADEPISHTIRACDSAQCAAVHGQLCDAPGKKLCGMQVRGDGASGAGPVQEPGQEPGQGLGQVEEETNSLQGSMEGSALRAGPDQDAESSVNSLLGPALGMCCCISSRLTATDAHNVKQDQLQTCSCNQRQSPMHCSAAPMHNLLPLMHAATAVVPTSLPCSSDMSHLTATCMGPLVVTAIAQ